MNLLPLVALMKSPKSLQWFQLHHLLPSLLSRTVWTSSRLTCTRDTLSAAMSCVPCLGPSSHYNIPGLLTPPAGSPVSTSVLDVEASTRLCRGSYSATSQRPPAAAPPAIDTVRDGLTTWQTEPAERPAPTPKPDSPPLPVSPPLLHPQSLMQFRKGENVSTGHKAGQQRYVGGAGCENSCTAFRITWRWWLKTFYFLESWVMHQACKWNHFISRLQGFTFS